MSTSFWTPTKLVVCGLGTFSTFVLSGIIMFTDEGKNIPLEMPITVLLLSFAALGYVGLKTYSHCDTPSNNYQQLN